MHNFEKFQAPIVQLGLVDRPRIQAALLSSIEHNAVTTIVAPAGSGKSIILLQAMRSFTEAGGRGAWYACDQFDRDRRHFLSMLHLAVTRHHNVIAPKRYVSEALVSVGDPRAIINAARQEADRFVLFIDNFHTCDTPETAAILDALAGESGGTIHLVITSRVPPRLTLGHLRLRGLVGEFDSNDLAFTANEACALLAEYGAPDEANAISEILARTEGWAAAVQVIRILAHGGANIRDIAHNFSGADQDLRQFLNEEVMRTLSPSTQEFLLRTAHLEKFSIDLAEFATGVSNAADAFNDVVDRNLFVTALDRRGEWIRLHSVFRDYLVALAQVKDRERYPTVLARAAQWHAQKNDWPAAIDYAIRAERFDLANAWLAMNGQEMVERRGETAFYLLQCERIPEELRTDPTLLFWMLWATFFSSDYEHASKLLKTHQNTIQAAPEFASNVSLLQFLVALFQHRLREALDLGPTWLAANLEASHFNRATCAGGIAMALQAQLQQAQARKYVELGRVEINRSNSIYGRGWICAISAQLSLAAGNVHDAKAEVDAYLKALPTGHRMRQTVNLVLAEIYYELNDLENCEAVLKPNLASIAEHSTNETAMAGWQTAARLAILKGNVPDALTIIAEALLIAARRFGDYPVVLLQTLQNEIILSLGAQERRRLSQGIDANLPPPKERNTWCNHALERATLVDAQRLLVSGAPRRALNAVQPVVNSAYSAGRLRAWAEAICIKVGALQTEGDTHTALRTLLDCIERCAPLGLYRTFLDRSSLLQPLCPALSAYIESNHHSLHPAADQLIRAILNLSKPLQALPSVQGSPIEQTGPTVLTAREVGLLRLAAQGMANAEIASRLVIRLPTVKTHFQNIFAKLEVKNRTAAISKARAQGLID